MALNEANKTLEPQSSSSLETMLGCLTEVGRETALTPSSESSGPAPPPLWKGTGLPRVHGPGPAAGRTARRNLQPR